ncbi:glycosyl transferase family 1 [Hoeflea halophila]|uniref:Glycosyl transferase family 1 n=1 Tax=Hoeflea halophila TaxID=714899 RepID=A0A286IGM0_9HYPH|nr:glycosyltransferase [Hoeflea halophila]SOE18494.1 glycosyl transferase family 1 [Hoeflea halophila]
MKIVHITPHLGGGVGKAHASLCAADPDAAGHHYVLLEEPRDRRYLEQVLKAGAQVSLAGDDDRLRGLMAAADIVQFEWWNHPLMCGLLAGPPLPAMRPVFWSHVSGVSAPFIPPGLIEAADRFVFTSACSRLAPNLEARHLARTEVINSGFCHDEPGLPGSYGTRTGISYLGTIDFTKMSPAMMQVIDRLDSDDVGVDVWGGVASDSPVHAAIAAMANPGRFRLRGHSDDPVAALSQSSIFLYLLQPFHFGTAENALVEAMSLGCVPLVFANPCELAIVRDGETGLVARSVDHAVEQLSWMLEHPDEVSRIGVKAREEVRRLKTPVRSVAAFRSVWEAELQQPKRIADFAAALGPTPRNWHEALNGGAPTTREASPQVSQSASKGSLAHFRAWYPDLDQAHRKPAASRA